MTVTDTPTTLFGVTIHVETDWQRARVAEIAVLDAAVADWHALGRDAVRRELRACARQAEILNTVTDNNAHSRDYVVRALSVVREFVDAHGDYATSTPSVELAEHPQLSERQRELVCTAIRMHMLRVDITGATAFPSTDRGADMQALADALYALDPGPDVPTLPMIHHHVTLPGDSDV